MYSLHDSGDADTKFQGETISQDAYNMYNEVIMFHNHRLFK